MNKRLLLVVFSIISGCNYTVAQPPSKRPLSANFVAAQLNYLVADTMNATGFYTEVSLGNGAATKVYSVTAVGFDKGMFGFENKGTIRTVVFGLNSYAATKPDTAVRIRAVGAKVVVKNNLAYWNYAWKENTVYRFYLHLLTDSASSTAYYTGYLFVPEIQKWKLLGSFKLLNNAEILRKVYSGVACRNIASTINNSKVYVSNQWLLRKNGQWSKVTHSAFQKFTPAGMPENDLIGGMENNRFYFAMSKEITPVKQGSFLSEEVTAEKPVVDVTRNVDSAAQATMDRLEILAAVRKGKYDTTGSKEGVYYLILNQGSGAQVKLTDTVTVHYKGWLLKDGTVFDQTKDKPATFPLNRLIRGWQVGVPLLNVGGRIRLMIPSALAYSTRSRSKDIPPNSVLTFDVEVLKAGK